MNQMINQNIGKKIKIEMKIVTFLAGQSLEWNLFQAQYYMSKDISKEVVLIPFKAFGKSVQLTSYNIYTWVKELTRNFLMCVSCLFLPAAHPALLFSSLKRNLPQQRKPLALLVPPLPAARVWR